MTKRAETLTAQEEEDDPCAGSETAASRSRRAYHPPRLECLGRLAEVTRFGGSEIVDSGGGLGNQL